MKRCFRIVAAILFPVLPIATRHVAAVSNFPPHHRDPFDRLLAVQTRIENYTIVTHDPLLLPYGVQALW